MWESSLGVRHHEQPRLAMDQTDLIAALNHVVSMAGRAAWTARLAELKRGCTATYAGRALGQRHALELTVERLRQPGRTAKLTQTEQRIAALATELAEVAERLSPAGRARLSAALAECLRGENTLVPLFHLMRTALLHRRRGFSVSLWTGSTRTCKAGWPAIPAAIC